MNKKYKFHRFIRRILKQQCKYCRHYIRFSQDCSINIGVWGDHAYCTCFERRNKNA